MAHIKKSLLDYLIENDGLPKNMFWWQVGDQFNVEPADVQRAQEDE